MIDLRGGVMQATVVTADFRAYNGKEDELRAQGVRIFGPGASAAQDFEPEYITVSRNSQTAWVVLQENNAPAVVDIKTATITDVLPLGTKDHMLPGNEFDASNRDGEINITNWPTNSASSIVVDNGVPRSADFGAGVQPQEDAVEDRRPAAVAQPAQEHADCVGDMAIAAYCGKESWLSRLGPLP